MTTTPPADERSELLQLQLRQLHALGFSVAELAAAEAGGPCGPVSVADFLHDRVLPALKPRSHKVWAPYVRLIIDGYPGLCSCFCPACLATFTPTSQWEPCRCVTAGRCTCPADGFDGSVSAGSCLEHCTVLGGQPLARLGLADWERLARWAELRAAKRTAVRNGKRGTEGRATFTHDGRSAVEHLRNLVSKTYGLALDDGVPGVRVNFGTRVSRKPRPAAAARAYSAEHLEELWDVLCTSSSRDPQLDVLLVWTLLETGSRRGAPIKMRMGDLLCATTEVRLAEKNHKVDAHPVTPELLQAILTQALERGDVLTENPENLDPATITVADVCAGRVRLRTDAPAFYYEPRRHVADDGTVLLEPRPLTARRFGTLWARLRKDLPWLDEIHGRPHDLRKTSGTFIERAFGTATAGAWLRHTPIGTTGLYTVATTDEVAAAHRWLTGTDGDSAPTPGG